MTYRNPPPQFVFRRYSQSGPTGLALTANSVLRATVKPV